MLKEWDEYVKWDPDFHEQQENTPGCTIPSTPRSRW